MSVAARHFLAALSDEQRAKASFEFKDDERVNLVTGDYSRGIAGFWIENGALTYPVSKVTIAGHLFDIFRTLTPANDLTFRYGTNAPTSRIEGLTLAGQ